MKKPIKKPVKQALILTLAMLTPSVTPPASNTCFISNTYAYLHITSVIFKAFAINKYKKPFTPFPLGLFKFSQYTKLIKIT